MPSQLTPQVTSPNEAMISLRKEVRAFLQEEIESGAITPGVDTWLTKWDNDFTRKLAQKGWLGLTVPKEYGGHGRTFLERFVVTEELLSVGAPVAAQWVADRQIAPSLLRYGTDEQKQTWLPKIVAGETIWAIGMSEPDSGSDLASVRTKGEKVEGGWRLNGTKVWTSGAQFADAFIALARTEPLDTSNRHAGLSQFIVDLKGEGVIIRPIISLSGDHHFNEVILDNVFVPDNMVFGTLGNGWEQVNSELAFERSGPERFLSSFRLFAAEIGAASRGEIAARSTLARDAARMASLHNLSQNVAGSLQRGENPATTAALVKLLGTSFEGDIVESLAQSVGVDAFSAKNNELQQLLAEGLHQRPGFTLRGGTNEILRGVIARGLGVR